MRQYILLLSLLLFMQSVLRGQCYPDRHSTNWFDGWISCNPAPNPNGSGENAHWILYDFGASYKLGQMTIWNTNDPAHLDWGMRDVLIQVSQDGIEWADVGTYTFAQANGSSTYQGFTGPDLGGIEGRFLLITAQSNWGGECYGLSEIRIDAEETIVSSVQDLSTNNCFTLAATPNPFVHETEIEIFSQCPGTFEYAIIDVLGRIIRQGKTDGGTGMIKLRLNFNDLPQGTYYLRIAQQEKVGLITLVKFNRA